MPWFGVGFVEHQKAAFVADLLRSCSPFGAKIQQEFGKESWSCYSNLHQITDFLFIYLEKARCFFCNPKDDL